LTAPDGAQGFGTPARCGCPQPWSQHLSFVRINNLSLGISIPTSKDRNYLWLKTVSGRPACRPSPKAMMITGTDDHDRLEIMVTIRWIK
jgi:hypothetical protein